MATCTLILLPGMHGTADLFGPFLAALPNNVARCIIAYPTDLSLDYDELVDWTLQQTTDLTDMVLMGESFSAPVAIRLAAKAPSRVRAIVLIGGFATPPWPSWLRWFIYSVAFHLPMPAIAIRFLVAGWQLPGEFINELRQAIRKPSPHVLAFRSNDALTADSSAALRACGCPVLAIHGRQDHIVPVYNATRLLRIRPDVEVHRTDGPHLLLQAQPEQSWSTIRAFLIRHRVYAD